MCLDVIDRHSEALFEFLWCPVCGHEVFSHIPFEGVFCKHCNTQVELQESRETRGYEEAVLACFDTDTTWNLHVDEKPRRDLPDGSARVKILGAPGAYEVDWWSPEPGEDWEPVECGEFDDVDEPADISHSRRKKQSLWLFFTPRRVRGCSNEQLPNRQMSRPNDTHSIEQTRPASDCDIAYVGYRQSGQAIVEKRPDQERLTPERSLALVNHSPSGFEWGYGGSGPAQLALALLLDYTDDESFALDHYQAFKTEVVSQLDCAGSVERWRLTGREIDAALHETSRDPVAPSI